MREGVDILAAKAEKSVMTSWVRVVQHEVTNEDAQFSRK